MLVKM
jgi:hypothetical protein